MIFCSQLTRNFAPSTGSVLGISEVSFQANRGEFVVLHGASGSGKSTLLLILGGMLQPDSGTLSLDGFNPYALTRSDASEFRARTVGFVFQLFHLIPYLDVRLNILAGLPAGSPDATSRAEELIQQLGLLDRQKDYPATLSAGERQRVALARALLKSPKVILADEPTGNLDPANAAIVLGHLDAYRKRGGTVLLATHGSDADRYADRILRLDAGVLVSSVSCSPTPTSPR
jgi:putative ABC transport system ATP-binding protein